MAPGACTQAVGHMEYISYIVGAGVAGSAGWLAGMGSSTPTCSAIYFCEGVPTPRRSRLPPSPSCWVGNRNPCCGASTAWAVQPGRHSRAWGWLKCAAWGIPCPTCASCRVRPAMRSGCSAWVLPAVLYPLTHSLHSLRSCSSFVRSARLPGCLLACFARWVLAWVLCPFSLVLTHSLPWLHSLPYSYPVLSLTLPFLLCCTLLRSVFARSCTSLPARARSRSHCPTLESDCT